MGLIINTLITYTYAEDEPIKWAKVKDFATVVHQGARSRGRFAGAIVRVETLALGSSDGHQGRLFVHCAVIVSKRVIDKRAVVRNRVKRRVRPLFRSQGLAVLQDISLPLSGHGLRISWVVRPQRNSLEAGWKELSTDVHDTFKNALLRELKRLSLDTPIGQGPGVAPGLGSAGVPEGPEPGPRSPRR